MTKTTIKYKSPEDLGLSLRQYSALLAAQNLLALGLLKHSPYEHAHEGERVFNMNRWCDNVYDEDGERHCGTAQCIGGTMQWILGNDDGLYPGEAPFQKVLEENKAIRSLFFPGEGTPEYDAIERYGWGKIKAEQAVKAIENFRRYGEPRWDLVLGVEADADMEYDVE